jgi:hypothetical protein
MSADRDGNEHNKINDNVLIEIGPVRKEGGASGREGPGAPVESLGAIPV